MKIYCSHSVKKFHKASNYYQCHLCPATWYGIDDIPLIVIGYTNQDEVGPARKEKDLTKKKFKRCQWCHDTVEKRVHIRCKIQQWLDKITVGPAPERRK